MSNDTKVRLPNGKRATFHTQSFGTGSGYVYVGSKRVYGSRVQAEGFGLDTFVPSTNSKHRDLVAAAA